MGNLFQRKPGGQTALEYLLLLAIVAGVVLVSFKTLVPNVQQNSEAYYNKVARVILGETPEPVNGGWCPASCPANNDSCIRAVTRQCACPAPAFGGQYCTGSPFLSCSVGANCVCTPQATAGVIDCSAPTPDCQATTTGLDSCGNVCSKTGGPCGTCPSPVPSGGTVCPGSNQNVPVGTSWTAVTSEINCNGKCQVYCDLGREPDGGSCVPYRCTGAQPANTVRCDDEVSSPGQSYQVVADPTGCSGECDVYCNLYSRFNGSACTPNCAGTRPAGVTECPNAATDRLGPQGNWTPVETCSGARCEYLNCSTPFNATRCSQFQCLGSYAGGTPCSTAAPTSDTTISFVNTCAVPPAACSATCPSGQVPNGSGTACTTCGNGVPDAGETCTSCPQDVTAGCLPAACSIQADGSTLCAGSGCSNCPFGTGSFRGAVVCNMVDPSTGHVWQGGYYGLYGFTGWRTETQAVICRATGGWDNSWQMRP